MIQTAILAGGLGMRMRPLTETAPKPMIPVAGRPFLEHQIELLKSSGVDRILLLVSYLGKVIEDHLGDGRQFGVSITYSYEPEPLGTGGALRHAAPLLEDEFLLVNGDTLLDIAYRDFVAAFRASDAWALTAAYRNRSQLVPSNLELTADGTVLAYNKQQPTGDHVDAGVTAARKAVLDLLPPARKSSFEQQVFPALIQRRRLLAWPTETDFFDMGTPSGLAALERRLQRESSAR